MNERIKQLAEQAWTMVSDEERARNELYEADTQRERRDQVFAELIVRECSKVNNQYVGWRIGDIDLDMVYKEHFGI